MGLGAGRPFRSHLTAYTGNRIIHFSAKYKSTLCGLGTIMMVKNNVWTDRINLVNCKKCLDHKTAPLLELGNIDL